MSAFDAGGVGEEELGGVGVGGGEHGDISLRHLDVIDLQDVDKIFQSDPPVGVIVRL